jgi:hypothetical protein
MIKLINGSTRLGRVAARNLVIDEVKADWFPHRTFEQLRDDLEIRRILQRAMSREEAPQALVDAIKRGIRR